MTLHHSPPPAAPPSDPTNKANKSVLMLILSFAATLLLTSCLVGTTSMRFPLTMDILKDNILSNILESRLLPPPLGNESRHESDGLLTLQQQQQDRQEEEQLYNIALPAGVCNLFDGEWVAQAGPPFYTNITCPILSDAQDCEANGRRDRGYLEWRWQPAGCELPRFDARTFLRVMHGRTLAFVGDSVARNQMESLMCMLWQAEEPVNRGTKKMQRWYFPSERVTVIRMWSAWLVNTTEEAWDYAPAKLTKLQLEVADAAYVELLPTLDVLVISGGHWFVKRTAYLLKGKLVGGQLWSHASLPADRLSLQDAFGLAMRTSMGALASERGFKGLVILRTYSPDHYEGGAWNTGGSCTGKTRPFSPREVAFNAYTHLMRLHQLRAFAQAKRTITNASRFRLLDITPIFHLRADGHPGPFRSRDPNKITQRGPDGRPPPQDCLHWCMPGPIDTWNELLLQILREELLK